MSRSQDRQTYASWYCTVSVPASLELTQAIQLRGRRHHPHEHPQSYGRRLYWTDVTTMPHHPG